MDTICVVSFDCRAHFALKGGRKIDKGKNAYRSAFGIAANAHEPNDTRLLFNGRNGH